MPYHTCVAGGCFSQPALLSPSYIILLLQNPFSVSLCLLLLCIAHLIPVIPQAPGVPRVTAIVAPSAPTQTHMKTGPRSPISPNGDASRTGSHSETTVSATVMRGQLNTSADAQNNRQEIEATTRRPRTKSWIIICITGAISGTRRTDQINADDDEDTKTPRLEIHLRHRRTKLNRPRL